MRKLWEDEPWEVYIQLTKVDKLYIKKVNQILKDIDRNGYANAEALRANLSGKYSRRVNKKDRIVFEIDAETLIIYSIKGHYDD